MAMPRYLYSINDSMRDPLLVKPENIEDDEVETLAMSPEHSPIPEEDSDRFEQDVVLSPTASEARHSDLYISARLAAAGIPAPTEARDKDNLISGAFSLTFAHNAPESGAGEVSHRQYGTYEYNYNEGVSAGKNYTHLISTGDDSSSAGYKNDKKRTKHEDAALYVREGEDNDKFYQHPRGKWSKRAYNILHSTLYHIFNLSVCVLLLLLALMEHPYLGDEANLPQPTLVAIIVVHALLEVLLLAVLWLDMLLRFLWFRPKHFLRHRRTMLVLVVLVVMSVEAVVVLARQENHFRITRALRPIFLLDTFLMHGVRRVLRQIFLSIRPIFDVISLLALALIIFSLLGYLIFADLDVTYFVTFGRSLVSFFIAATTANHPDVWLEVYLRQPASALFFILYIIVMVYFISNVLLAVVYSNFSEADKNKFRKLFLHKRDALRRAHQLLATSPDGIQFEDFLLFMHKYRPRLPEWQVMCIFKALQRSSPRASRIEEEEEVGQLGLEHFYGFYEVIDLKWKRVTLDGEELTWFKNCHAVIRKPATVVYKLVKSKVFNIIINLIVLANFLFLSVYVLFIDEKNVGNRFYILNKVVSVSLIFVSFYAVEISLRLFGLGPYNYFRKLRNIIDFVVISTSLLLLILEAVSPVYSVLAVFRPVKFIRLLRLKRHYRNIIDTLYVLSRRLISVGLLLLIVYYSFAIVGMEFFSETVYESCCNGSMYDVGAYYNGNNSTFTVNVYYLLNFDNILRSYVTLFMLMVVNNWFIVMEGFASTSRYDWLVRLYFMSFYLITLVVLQVIISFIVEAFVFNIQANERRKHCLKHSRKEDCDCSKANKSKKVAYIRLQEVDIKKLRYEITYSAQAKSKTSLSMWIKRYHSRLDISKEDQDYVFTGRRLRTKDDIHLLMYRSELEDWIKEHDREMKTQLQEEGPKEAPIRVFCKVAWRYLFNIALYIVE